MRLRDIHDKTQTMDVHDSYGVADRLDEILSAMGTLAKALVEIDDSVTGLTVETRRELDRL